MSVEGFGLLGRGFVPGVVVLEELAALLEVVEVDWLHGGQPVEQLLGELLDEHPLRPDVDGVVSEVASQLLHHIGHVVVLPGLVLLGLGLQVLASLTVLPILVVVLPVLVLVLLGLLVLNCLHPSILHSHEPKIIIGFVISITSLELFLAISLVLLGLLLGLVGLDLRLSLLLLLVLVKLLLLLLCCLHLSMDEVRDLADSVLGVEGVVDLTVAATPLFIRVEESGGGTELELRLNLTLVLVLVEAGVGSLGALDGLQDLLVVEEVEAQVLNLNTL
mmetsp:Transcript_13366/g.22744  ORF Transcript_13366/g.22744 Transcript_13366/m.22744 type:complete len:276 (-) Transcript_13366:13-840(-)